MFNGNQLSAQTTQLAQMADILPLVEECQKLKSQAQAAMSQLLDSKVFHFIGKTVQRLDRYNISGLPHPDRFHGAEVNKTIDADFWDKVMRQMGLLDYLAASERDQWHNAIAECNVPEFTEDNIRSHFAGMMKDLPAMFAQRVLGLYQSLSREHLTNNPQGFGKRQIVNISCGLGMMRYETVGTIHDVRNVLRQLRGESILPHRDTAAVISHMMRGLTGIWYRLDDDVRIKVFKKGTAHLEFSERASDELNFVLSLACANQLPPSRQTFYQKQYQRHRHGYKGKAFGRTQLLLNANALEFCKQLSGISPQSHYVWAYNVHADRPVTDAECSRERPFLCFPFPDDAMVRELIRLTGGEIQTDNQSVVYRYNPCLVMREICKDGVLPEYKSYQFYPTPSEITEALHAHIGDTEGLRILEPSYGAGNLLSWLDCGEKRQVTAVDISPLAASVARAQGCGAVYCRDFLAFGEDMEKFDLIVMNPPYTAGQAKAHVQHAKTLLKPDGRLFAVLPQAALEREMAVLGTFHNAFDNTGITTFLVEITIKKNCE